MKGYNILAGLGLVISLATPVSASTILGPDSYGYRATTDVDYQFQDISTTGTKLIGNADDLAKVASIGFAFDFYGTTYTQAYLSTNGLISFLSANNGYSNVSLFSGMSTAPAIATFWDDLTTVYNYNGSNDPSRGVYFQTLGEAGHRRFVVQEIASRYNFNGGSINFQTVLDEASGSILMRYTQTAFGVPAVDNGISATVGIVGKQAGQVLQYSYNQASLANDMSLCFTRSENGVCAAPLVGGAVPEPASWALFTLGFGALGAAMRRRKVSARLVAA